MRRLTDYSDLSATRQVIGCIMIKPEYIKQYNIVETDFAEKLYQYVFSAIDQLHNSGAKIIDAAVIMDYLQQYKVQYKNFQHNNGFELLVGIEEITDIENFEYNINIVKKFALLRDYTNIGIDVGDFFDPEDYEFADIDRKRKFLEDSSVEDIMTYIQTKIIDVNRRYNSNFSGEISEILDGENYLKSLKENFYGISFASEFLNTVTHGQQRGKIYLNSAGSGVGKSRNLIAHMCCAFAPEVYDSKKEVWIGNINVLGNKALYIGTEMDIKTEVMPILLAYISDVSQEKIMNDTMTDEERKRVIKAMEVFNQKKMILKDLPDYTMASLEMFIRNKVRNDNVTHIYLDYIHSSFELLTEFSKKSGKGMAMREDQALANISKVLKDLARELNVCIVTATQITGDADSNNRGAQLIRGSKAIVDKVDVGIVFTRPTESERKAWKEFPKSEEANLVYNIYKNRGGEYNNIKIVLNVNYSTMRFKDLFVVDNSDKLVKEYDGRNIPKTQIFYNDSGIIEKKERRLKRKIA